MPIRRSPIRSPGLTPGIHLPTIGVPRFATRAIAMVETSVPAFFGVAPRDDAFLRRPMVIRGEDEFERMFGSSTAAATHLARAVAGFFLNAGGGARCHVVNLGPGITAIEPAHLAAIAGADDVSLVAAPGFTDAASHAALIADCEARGDRIAVLDVAAAAAGASTTGTGAGAPGATAAGFAAPRRSPEGFATACAPWLLLPSAAGSAPAPCAPSGHICGVYARTDRTRGVHKPPANIDIRGAIGIERTLSAADMQALTLAGINPLRQFPGEVRVWGARTVAPTGSEFRYIAPRRLAIMIEQSIRRGTGWAVREPNTPRLWSALRTAVEAFLHGLLRQGALAGATAREASFVRCDRSTTTQADIDARRAVLEVGFAPLRPAEFMVLRIPVPTA